MPDPRDELVQLVADLKLQARLLKDFGIQRLRPRRAAVSPVAKPPAPEPEAEETALARQPGYKFGDARKAKWEQGIRKKEEHGKRSEPEPAAAAVQSTLFGGSGTPQASASAALLPRWHPNPLSQDEAAAKLAEVRREIGECTRCRLSAGRHNIVFGEGNPTAKLVFAGEGPGEEEDRTGRPFVGRAGQLLDRMIAAMNLRREDVYICNVVKCRPPNNRVPQEDEMRTCGQFLTKQLQILAPRHIVCLGATAAKYLLNTTAAMGKIRGRFFDDPSGAKLVATYHPAYLLRNPAAKKPVWEDLQKVMAEMAAPLE